ncbi:hypothetical protein KEM56_001633 [Ascosphaera pollenicola]|nr:hypothetical protein KEM56_001633 [Ascosphaera pollenicola]
MKLLLSTSNVMTSTPLVGQGKSNTELINGLKFNFASAKSHVEQKEHHQSTGSGSQSQTSEAYKSWTSLSADNSTLYVPCEEFMFEDNGLAEPRDQYDITVKLFYLPGVPPERRCEQTHDAVQLVCRNLRVTSIDLLIVSSPGVSLDAEPTTDDDIVEQDTPQAQTQTNKNCCNDSPDQPDSLETMLATWRTLESLVQNGTVRHLGLAEFDTHRLSTFLNHVAVPPTVDQIYARDCCVVPDQLILFAKEHGIRLLTHNDCTDILPRGTTREILSDRSQDGAGILAGDNGRADDGGLKGDVAPQWVVKYTAVVKDRGVIENKGYFAVAQTEDM